MSGKIKFPRTVALDAAREILRVLTPHCEKIVVAGSLRRLKPEVGDVEILYVPKFGPGRDDLFNPTPLNLADEALAQLLKAGIIAKRLSIRGSVTWGPSNKLAIHCASRVPIDFFEARPANWFNLLVSRTGSAETNIRICEAAQRKGWKWHPYSVGFTDAQGYTFPVCSEEDAFRLVGLPYLQPRER